MLGISQLAAVRASQKARFEIVRQGKHIACRKGRAS
jgi:hypothetical protein